MVVMFMLPRPENIEARTAIPTTAKIRNSNGTMKKNIAKKITPAIRDEKKALALLDIPISTSCVKFKCYQLKPLQICTLVARAVGSFMNKFLRATIIVSALNFMFTILQTAIIASPAFPIIYSKPDIPNKTLCHER